MSGPPCPRHGCGFPGETRTHSFNPGLNSLKELLDHILEQDTDEQQAR
jgi:hypothetical protein